MKLFLVIPQANYPQAHPAFLPNTDFPVGFAGLDAALKLAEQVQVGFRDNFIFGGLVENFQTGQCCVPVVETTAVCQAPCATTERERHGNGNRPSVETYIQAARTAGSC